RYKHLLINNKVDSFKREKRFIDKNGLIVWTYIAVSAVRSENGALLYYVVQIEDITDRILANKKLEKTLSELEKIMDSSLDII
ncbi:PAS domain S-box protein, partial [Streptomyces brasiliscabiei]